MQMVGLPPPASDTADRHTRHRLMKSAGPQPRLRRRLYGTWVARPAPLMLHPLQCCQKVPLFIIHEEVQGMSRLGSTSGQPEAHTHAAHASCPFVL